MKALCLQEGKQGCRPLPRVYLLLLCTLGCNSQGLGAHNSELGLGLLFFAFFFPIPFYLITWINCQIVCSGTSSSPREPDGQISRKLNRTEREERSTVLPTEMPPAPRAPLAVVCTSEPSPRKSKLCRKLSCANLGQALICRQAKRKLAQVFFFFFFYLLRWVKPQCSLLELFYFNSQRGCWRSFDFISVNLSW